MKALAAERICKFSDVLCQPRHGQLCGSRNVGLTVTTHVRTHDAKMAGEYGHPFVEPPRAAHRGVDEDQRLARPPRIAEVLVGVREPQAIARGHRVHYGAQADATDRCNRR